MTTQETPSAPTIAPSARRRAIVSSAIGNGLEWFDFGIFSSFSLIISRLMFPPQSGAATLMVAFASFGIAFLVRPVGGVLLGMYADRAGRKAALSAIILMMSAGTLLIGLTPSYATIGIAASVMIVGARMLQGFSAGGEFASATAMLLEYSPRGQRNLIGSFQACSQALSFALGGAVAFLLLHNLTPLSLQQWGWRLPFLFGALIGPVGYYIRSRVDESPEFVAFINQKRRTPQERLSLVDIVRRYPRELLATLGIVAVCTTSAYVGLIYIPIFASGALGLDAGTGQLGMLVGAVVLLLMSPLTGYLSDRIGRRRVMVPAMLLYGVLAYPLLASLVNAPGAVSLIRFELVLAFLMSFFWGPSAAALAEAFPVQIRSTGMAIVYNLGAMCFGGLAPLINTWLTKVTGDRLAPAWYIAASVVLGTLGVLVMTQRESAAQEASLHA
ncbi:MFS transporter [Paraburkholderia silviterrae]|uniref:MFS transporter n=1 Tax=Paraburkholderia silviterrae TaxID=2528715 RepID=A0A4R5M507_9BURK|nr:MFS transporter [Paraburkholderia silviterrae]TDG20496.1 MFS transporter [Paraburkholderia silviterrae]